MSRRTIDLLFPFLRLHVASSSPCACHYGGWETLAGADVLGGIKLRGLWPFSGRVNLTSVHHPRVVTRKQMPSEKSCAMERRLWVTKNVDLEGVNLSFNALYQYSYYSNYETERGCKHWPLWAKWCSARQFHIPEVYATTGTRSNALRKSRTEVSSRSPAWQLNWCPEYATRLVDTLARFAKL